MRPVMRRVWPLLTLAMLSGCIVLRVSAVNPIPGLSKVAVAPFFNLSDEKAVDGRRFALAYQAELQKVQGFQVIPVGIVEDALREHRLTLDNPDDVHELAKLLDADAVVIGAVSDYKPYYPPRIVLQVAWYSPRPWLLPPCLETSPGPECPAGGGESPHFLPEMQTPRGYSLLRGQSPDELPAHSSDEVPGQSPNYGPVPPLAAVEPPCRQTDVATLSDPSQALMSYTRLFDGADPQLVVVLRDYVELRGDLRSGGWEGYLYRSDDFIRFASHMMIVEMLSLHGGATKTEIVLKLRKNR